MKASVAMVIRLSFHTKVNAFISHFLTFCRYLKFTLTCIFIPQSEDFPLTVDL